MQALRTTRLLEPQDLRQRRARHADRGSVGAAGGHAVSPAWRPPNSERRSSRRLLFFPRRMPSRCRTGAASDVCDTSSRTFWYAPGVSPSGGAGVSPAGKRKNSLPCSRPASLRPARSEKQQTPGRFSWSRRCPPRYRRVRRRSPNLRDDQRAMRRVRRAFVASRGGEVRPSRRRERRGSRETRWCSRSCR